MRMIRAESVESFGELAGAFVDERLERGSLIALPTGATPRPLYAELARRAARDRSRLAGARFVNLDEYLGLERRDPRSFAAFLERELIAPARLAPGQIHLIDGAAADPFVECERYEAFLAERGGIDLCILGVGENGHIAFNEPGTAWNRRTHVAGLASSTRARLETQGWEAPPTRGITLGIENVLEAREVLLLIAGSGKQAAAAALHRGIEDLAWPLTCLVRHGQVTVIELCVPSAPL